MSHKSFLLDPATWDLTVTGTHDIALAAQPYAQAQNAACAIKLFLGEDYYDTTRGVPYWEQVLGHWPPVSLMKSLFMQAAMTVPFVVSAQCFIDSIVDRRPKGQVIIKLDNGAIAATEF
jgi:hypothetical protein